MNFPPSLIGEVCIPNINAKERRKRLNFSIVGFVVSFIFLAVLIGIDAPLWWRLFLFPMLAGSANGFFQWRDKT